MVFNIQNIEVPEKITSHNKIPLVSGLTHI